MKNKEFCNTKRTFKRSYLKFKTHFIALLAPHPNLIAFTGLNVITLIRPHLSRTILIRLMVVQGTSEESYGGVRISICSRKRIQTRVLLSRVVILVLFCLNPRQYTLAAFTLDARLQKQVPSSCKSSAQLANILLLIYCNVNRVLT